jgi:NAD-reducing hydrogenase large subunit
MAGRVAIDAVTRIEGHAKITIYPDDGGNVADAQLHVAGFRGIEKSCEGRSLAEMPGITARICGICHISHLLASAKACDAIFAVSIASVAVKLRPMMNLCQIIRFHALSLFHLSAPDFLLGWEGGPQQRNVFSLAVSHPGLERSGIRLRRFGQEVMRILGGRKVDPARAVPGGRAGRLPG